MESIDVFLEPADMSLIELIPLLCVFCYLSHSFQETKTIERKAQKIKATDLTYMTGRQSLFSKIRHYYLFRGSTSWGL